MRKLAIASALSCLVGTMLCVQAIMAYAIQAGQEPTGEAELAVAPDGQAAVAPDGNRWGCAGRTITMPASWKIVCGGKAVDSQGVERLGLTVLAKEPYVLINLQAIEAHQHLIDASGLHDREPDLLGHVLAHELCHVSGIIDEAEAEKCAREQMISNAELATHM
jgi:hypothetical protein